MALIKINNRSINDSYNTGRRNVLINGNFSIWQRATSYTYTSGIWVYGHADRWGGHFDGPPTGSTYSRSTTVPNELSEYSLVMTHGSGGAGSAYLSQRVESRDLDKIRKENKMTVSGWVRTEGLAGRTMSINLICPSTGEDNYTAYTTHGAVWTANNTITGDATISSSSITFTSNDTWYYFTATCENVTSKSNFDKGMQLYFALGGMVDSSDKVYFSQLQVEAGDKVTPFEWRPYGEELESCKRFYEDTGVVYNRTAMPASSPRRETSYYTVEKRSNGTRTVYNSTGTSGVVRIAGADYAVGTVGSNTKSMTWETTSHPGGTSSLDVGWRIVTNSEL